MNFHYNKILIARRKFDEFLIHFEYDLFSLIINPNLDLKMSFYRMELETKLLWAYWSAEFQVKDVRALFYPIQLKTKKKYVCYNSFTHVRWKQMPIENTVIIYRNDSKIN